MSGHAPRDWLDFRSVIQMGMASFAIAEMGADERDYDNWLTTLTQASVRLDQLQKVVGELCQLCENEAVVQSRQVLEVLERHGALTKPADASSDAA
jgi:hypothetical protein